MTMNDLRLREADPADAPAIARLHAESWRVAYRGQYSDAFLDGPVFDDRRRVWDERLSSPTQNQHTIVAEGDGVIAGFACAFGDHDPQWGTLLDNIHVDPLRKRRGVGTQLIREVAGWAHREYAASGLYLSVLEANAPARRFYERLGARNAERMTSEPPGGGVIVSLRYVWASPEALLLVDAS
jgi:GNAT superfamily N-acetyltransferase